MTEDKYYIKISAENILSDFVKVPYTASTFVITGISGNCCFITVVPQGLQVNTGIAGRFLPMKTVLSSGPNGVSILTGLTIPILFRQTAVDMGYYSVFDGAILQKNVVTNFFFRQRPNNPMVVELYNTSEKDLKTFLNLSKYKIEWGDSEIDNNVNTFAPNAITHQYKSNGVYTITLTQETPWGVNTVKKTVRVPYTGITISNQVGRAFFSPMVGSWSSTSVSYDYIFPGDSENIISKQTSDNFVDIPFIVSGFTKSRLEELRQYGKKPFTQDCIKKTVDGKVNNCWGQITTNISVPMSFTGYTIEGVDYIDFDDSSTVYLFNSSGLTKNWMVQSAMTKNEELMNVVFDPEIQSEVFIERGKNSAQERVERLGEIDTIGDMETYGYKFFRFNTQ